MLRSRGAERSRLLFLDGFRWLLTYSDASCLGRVLRVRASVGGSAPPGKIGTLCPPTPISRSLRRTPQGSREPERARVAWVVSGVQRHRWLNPRVSRGVVDAVLQLEVLDVAYDRVFGRQCVRHATQRLEDGGGRLPLRWLIRAAVPVERASSRQVPAYGPKVTLLPALGAGLVICGTVSRTLVPAAKVAALTAVCARWSMQGCGWGLSPDDRPLLLAEGTNRGSRFRFAGQLLEGELPRRLAFEERHQLI